MKTTVQALSNIALIKYWGNADEQLRIPVNSSISFNLDGIYSKTSVTWDDSLAEDTLLLNAQQETGQALKRVSEQLDVLRKRLDITSKAQVESSNNFPMGAGIASSASSFAALTVAAVKAANMDLSERELTTLARIGSGSASRSVPSGFVQWHKGTSHETSFAESVAPPDHWGLVDLITIISSGHKTVGSREGHTSASTSDLQEARVARAEKRLETCIDALMTHDFPKLAEVVEYDSNLMHAVMMTSRPPLFYWLPVTLTVMDLVRQWRAEGLRVCYTLDAGPNVHCLCLKEDVDPVMERLQKISGVTRILRAEPGGGAEVVNE
jgi:diphosphomevalonate decarboxylase